MTTYRYYPPNQRLGHTFEWKDTLLKTLSQHSCYCMQIFLVSSRGYGTRVLTQSDKEQTKDYCDKTHKTFCVHCSYLANLSYPISDDKALKSVNHVNNMLACVNGLPGTCVLHIGKRGTIQNVANNINDHIVIPRSSSTPYLLLENAAGMGTELGKNWDELRKLFEGIDYNKVGLCIDTQHSFASGLCEFKDHEDVVKLFDEIDNCAKLGCIHLNDSLVPYRTYKDRHQNLRNGYIWYNNDESLKSLLDICFDRSIDVVLETPSKDDLDILKSYSKPTRL